MPDRPSPAAESTRGRTDSWRRRSSATTRPASSRIITGKPVQRLVRIRSSVRSSSGPLFAASCGSPSRRRSALLPQRSSRPTTGERPVRGPSARRRQDRAVPPAGAVARIGCGRPGRVLRLPSSPDAAAAGRPVRQTRPPAQFARHRRATARRPIERWASLERPLAAGR